MLNVHTQRIEIKGGTTQDIAQAMCIEKEEAKEENKILNVCNRLTIKTQQKTQIDPFQLKILRKKKYFCLQIELKFFLN